MFTEAKMPEGLGQGVEDEVKPGEVSELKWNCYI